MKWTVKDVLLRGTYTALAALMLIWAYPVLYPYVIPYHIMPWVAARARQRVVLLKPYMPEPQVWSTLGLTGYGLRAHTSGSGSPNHYPSTYQLGHSTFLQMQWNLKTNPPVLREVEVGDSRDGFALIALRNWTLEERVLRDCLNKDPHSRQAWTGLGKLLFRQQRNGEALEALRIALQPHPDWQSPYSEEERQIILHFDYTALFDYGYLCENSGDHSEAQNAYDQVIKNFIPSPDAPDVLSYLGKGLDQKTAACLIMGVYQNRENLEHGQDALQQYEEASRLQPDQPIVQCYLGIGLLKVGNVAEAQTALIKAQMTDDSSMKALAERIKQHWTTMNARNRIWP